MKNIDINALNFSYLLLEYAKDVGLNEDGTMVILMTYHILKKQPHSLITPELLSIKLTMATNKIDEVLSLLTQRGFITHVKEGRTLFTSLEPLFKILKERMVGDIMNVDAIDNNTERTSQLENLYTHFERELNRPLTPLEVDYFYNWLKKYKEKDIIDALIETKDISKKAVTIKNVNKTLLERAIKSERKKEGRSILISDVEETSKPSPEVVKVNWLE